MKQYLEAETHSRDKESVNPDKNSSILRKISGDEKNIQKRWSKSAPKWPDKVLDCYEPIRPLGIGGFASVWLGKSRTPCTNDEYVAIKALGSGVKNNNLSTRTLPDDEACLQKREKEHDYAQREIEILSELSHKNIVRLIKAFEPANDDDDNSWPQKKLNNNKKSLWNMTLTTHRCLVLSYARGPTLEDLIQEGGAIGLPLSRSIARQLLDAISYLHGRGVIHRDIKPDNMIITDTKAIPKRQSTSSSSSSTFSDEFSLIWSDGIGAERAASTNRWHLTIIDFGFARALRPSQIVDYVKKNGGMNDNKRKNESDVWMTRISLDSPLEDNAATGTGGDEGRGRDTRPRRRKSSGSLDELDSSISKAKVRDLSALGNRNYAAPEILTGVREMVRLAISIPRALSSSSLNANPSLESSLHRGHSKRQVRNDDDDDDDVKKNGHHHKHHHHHRQVLAPTVSDYGLVADAFSIGSTLRYMLTGVPPNEDVESYIALHNHPVAVLARNFGAAAKELSRNVMKTKINNEKKKKKKRKKQYKRNDDLPSEACHLVKSLTHWNPNKRATVRSAKDHPWVLAVEQEDENTTNSESVNLSAEHGGPINFLRCALEADNFDN